MRVQDAREELLLAEVDLAKAQAEGPASHRKRDYIDKATKEVSSAAFLQDSRRRVCSQAHVVLADVSG